MTLCDYFKCVSALKLSLSALQSLSTCDWKWALVVVSYIFLFIFFRIEMDEENDENRQINRKEAPVAR
jgi:hypothetical protein